MRNKKVAIFIARVYSLTARKVFRLWLLYSLIFKTVLVKHSTGSIGIGYNNKEEINYHARIYDWFWMVLLYVLVIINGSERSVWWMGKKTNDMLSKLNTYLHLFVSFTSFLFLMWPYFVCVIHLRVIFSIPLSIHCACYHWTHYPHFSFYIENCHTLTTEVHELQENHFARVPAHNTLILTFLSIHSFVF